MWILISLSGLVFKDYQPITEERVSVLETKSSIAWNFCFVSGKLWFHLLETMVSKAWN